MERIKKKCDCCGKEIISFSCGGEKCKYCGWIDDIEQRDEPEITTCSNLICLNKAKRLYKEGKKLLPSFQEFIEMLKNGYEFEFKVSGINYIIRISEEENYYLTNLLTHIEQEFEDLASFATFAYAETQKLSSAWEKLEYIDYL